MFSDTHERLESPFIRISVFLILLGGVILAEVFFSEVMIPMLRGDEWVRKLFGVAIGFAVVGFFLLIAIRNRRPPEDRTRVAEVDEDIYLSPYTHEDHPLLAYLAEYPARAAAHQAVVDAIELHRPIESWREVKDALEQSNQNTSYSADSDSNLDDLEDHDAWQGA